LRKRKRSLFCAVLKYLLKEVIFPYVVVNSIRNGKTSITKINIENMKAKLCMLMLFLGFMACSSGDLSQKIEELGKKMYDPATNRIDENVANEFIQTCEAFAKANPADEKSPDYLLKAGETARTMKNYTKGIALYDQIIAEYSEHPKAAQALFLKGFTLDNDMNQQDQAKAVYESFLAKYPSNEFADDTKFLLENLGKSDDEIIKSFEKQPAGE